MGVRVGYNPVYIAKAKPWWNPANRVAFDIRDANQDGVVEPSEANLPTSMVTGGSPTASATRTPTASRTSTSCAAG